MSYNAIAPATLNMYCWISSTFSIPVHWTGEVGKDVPHPGLGPTSDYDAHYHAYYQWVPFFLFLQAILFYMPHYIWRLIDGGKMKSLVQGLNSTSMLLDTEARKEKEKVLSKYFFQHLHLHNGWSFKFVFCELLNLANVIGNIYFTDKFLGYQFTDFGSRAVGYLRDPKLDAISPLVKVFPRVTKCTFHMYGPSGTIERHDTLCVLALNIINEKIFVFIWFWFVILAVVTGLQIGYRAVTLWSPVLRVNMLRTQARLNSQHELDVVNRKCLFGDWFMLYNLGRNLNHFVFSEFISDLVRVMDYEQNGNVMEMAPLSMPDAPAYVEKEKTY
ncbi:unnamed protein product [Notodromas monacha]|uniref:Innexin n=1 Tax=Notodromas monacha TaxID=399045 RepID=A0A7R9BKD4_9CRUS|nr:unnamed protein product [Notodromas monacha]CAG0917094.1 unnamed protein product [Notodromas monacha]